MTIPGLKVSRRPTKSLPCLLKLILFKLSLRARLPKSKSWSQIIILQLQVQNQEPAKMTGRRNPTPWNRDVLSIQPQRFARIAKPTIFARATTDVPVSSTYNSMYTTHTTEDHNTWRKEMDKKKRSEKKGGT